MKFIVSSSKLLKQLQIVSGVINSNNTLPILDNILFEISENNLMISASDLETTMSTSLEVESNINGSVAIPAKLLLETLKTFPEQPLTFLIDDEKNRQIDGIELIASENFTSPDNSLLKRCKSPRTYTVNP